jgi:hypothetical protein
MQDAEGYGNFKNAKPIIDPKTGLVLMSVKQKDNTYQTSSVADLQTRIKAKYDYFDTDAAATAVETGIGEEIGSALKAAGRGRGGSITAVQDKEIKDGFKGALTAQLESYLVNPLATSSILTNTLNKGYTPTFSREEAEKDPLKILMVTVPGGDGTPTPDFSTANGKKQQAEALDYMYKQVIQKIDVKVGQDAIGPIQDRALRPSYSGGGSGSSDTKVDNSTSAGAWNQLRFGTTKEAKGSAADILLGTPMAQAAGLLGIDLESRPGVVILTYADPTKNRSMPMYNTTSKDWAAMGVELHGESDVNRAMNAGGNNAGAAYGALGTDPNNWKGASSTRQGGKSIKNNKAKSGGNARD